MIDAGIAAYGDCDLRTFCHCPGSIGRLRFEFAGGSRAFCAFGKDDIIIRSAGAGGQQNGTAEERNAGAEETVIHVPDACRRCGIPRRGESKYNPGYPPVCAVFPRRTAGRN